MPLEPVASKDIPAQKLGSERVLQAQREVKMDLGS